ncbi:hypothetical protein ABPG72_003211 [Tetrahymena utriculariae]
MFKDENSFQDNNNNNNQSKSEDQQKDYQKNKQGQNSKVGHEESNTSQSPIKNEIDIQIDNIKDENSFQDTHNNKRAIYNNNNQSKSEDHQKDYQKNKQGQNSKVGHKESNSFKKFTESLNIIPTKQTNQYEEVISELPLCDSYLIKTLQQSFDENRQQKSTKEYYHIFERFLQQCYIVFQTQLNWQEGLNNSIKFCQLMFENESIIYSRYFDKKSQAYFNVYTFINENDFKNSQINGLIAKSSSSLIADLFCDTILYDEQKKLIFEESFDFSFEQLINILHGELEQHSCNCILLQLIDICLLFDELEVYYNQFDLYSVGFAYQNQKLFVKLRKVFTLKKDYQQYLLRSKFIKEYMNIYDKSHILYYEICSVLELVLQIREAKNNLIQKIQAQFISNQEFQKNGVCQKQVVEFFQNFFGDQVLKHYPAINMYFLELYMRDLKYMYNQNFMYVDENCLSLVMANFVIKEFILNIQNQRFCQMNMLLIWIIGANEDNLVQIKEYLAKFSQKYSQQCVLVLSYVSKFLMLIDYKPCIVENQFEEVIQLLDIIASDIRQDPIRYQKDIKKQVILIRFLVYLLQKKDIKIIDKIDQIYEEKNKLKFDDQFIDYGNESPFLLFSQQICTFFNQESKYSHRYNQERLYILNKTNCSYNKNICKLFLQFRLLDKNINNKLIEDDESYAILNYLKHNFQAEQLDKYQQALFPDLYDFINRIVNEQLIDNTKKLKDQIDFQQASKLINDDKIEGILIQKNLLQKEKFKQALENVSKLLKIDMAPSILDDLGFTKECLTQPFNNSFQLKIKFEDLDQTLVRNNSELYYQKEVAQNEFQEFLVQIQSNLDLKMIFIEDDNFFNMTVETAYQEKKDKYFKLSEDSQRYLNKTIHIDYESLIVYTKDSNLNLFQIKSLYAQNMTHIPEQKVKEILSQIFKITLMFFESKYYICKFNLDCFSLFESKPYQNKFYLKYNDICSISNNLALAVSELQTMSNIIGLKYYEMQFEVSELFYLKQFILQICIQMVDLMLNQKNNIQYEIDFQKKIDKLRNIYSVELIEFFEKSQNRSESFTKQQLYEDLQNLFSHWNSTEKKQLITLTETEQIILNQKIYYETIDTERLTEGSTFLHIYMNREQIENILKSIKKVNLTSKQLEQPELFKQYGKIYIQNQFLMVISRLLYLNNTQIDENLLQNVYFLSYDPSDYPQQFFRRQLQGYIQNNVELYLLRNNKIDHYFKYKKISFQNQLLQESDQNLIENKNYLSLIDLMQQLYKQANPETTRLGMKYWQYLFNEAQLLHDIEKQQQVSHKQLTYSNYTHNSLIRLSLPSLANFNLPFMLRTTLKNKVNDLRDQLIQGGRLNLIDEQSMKQNLENLILYNLDNNQIIFIKSYTQLPYKNFSVSLFKQQLICMNQILKGQEFDQNLKNLENLHKYKIYFEVKDSALVKGSLTFLNCYANKKAEFLLNKNPKLIEYYSSVDLAPSMKNCKYLNEEKQYFTEFQKYQDKNRSNFDLFEEVLKQSFKKQNEQEIINKYLKMQSTDEPNNGIISKENQENLNIQLEILNQEFLKVKACLLRYQQKKTHFKQEQEEEAQGYRLTFQKGQTVNTIDKLSEQINTIQVFKYSQRSKDNVEKLIQTRDQEKKLKNNNLIFENDQTVNKNAKLNEINTIQVFKDQQKSEDIITQDTKSNDFMNNISDEQTKSYKMLNEFLILRKTNNLVKIGQLGQGGQAGVEFYYDFKLKKRYALNNFQNQFEYLSEKKTHINYLLEDKNPKLSFYVCQLISFDDQTCQILLEIGLCSLNDAYKIQKKKQFITYDIKPQNMVLYQDQSELSIQHQFGFQLENFEQVYLKFIDFGSCSDDPNYYYVYQTPKYKYYGYQNQDLDFKKILFAETYSACKSIYYLLDEKLQQKMLTITSDHQLQEETEENKLLFFLQMFLADNEAQHKLSKMGIQVDELISLTEKHLGKMHELNKSFKCDCINALQIQQLCTKASLRSSWVLFKEQHYRIC